MVKTKIRIGFAGTPKIAFDHLSKLLLSDKFSVEFILTQPNKSAGRGMSKTTSLFSDVAKKIKSRIDEEDLVDDLKDTFKNTIENTSQLINNIIQTVESTVTDEEIKKLEGKKIIFTNGSRAHAENVTKRIGIDKLFDGIFDIRDSEFIPKPSKEPYKKIVENYKIEPQYCIFFEDIARNLKPAYELGMKTVWIKNDEPWAAKYSDSDFINYKTDSLAKFLKEINELR